MPKPLLSDTVNNSLNLLIQKLFGGNRLLDRQMSILSVKFVMKKTSDVCHPVLAHAYPLLLDEIGDYQDSKNCLTDYLDTPTNIADYETPIDLFQTYLDYSLELEEFIFDCISICENEGDRTTKAFLDKFLLQIQEYTSQAQLLLDRMSQYKDSPSDWMEFDRDIERIIFISQLRGKQYNPQN